MRAYKSFPVVLIGSVVAAGLVACTATNNSQDGSSPRPTDAATASSTVAPEVPDGLPDDVPLAAGAKLASSVTPIPSAGKVTGWTAVALTPVGTPVAETAAGLRQRLTKSGWAVTVDGSERTGIGISAKSPAVNPLRWLNISVTPALPDGGPALTYRFAQMPNPISTRPT